MNCHNFFWYLHHHDNNIKKYLVYTLHIRNIVPIVFAMITKLTERGTKRQLIIAVAVAAIMVIGIGSHTAFAIKVSNTSFQDGYNAGYHLQQERKIG
jgi:hypothetical protein